MAQDKTGLEDAEGLGLVDADALFTAQIQRLRQMMSSVSDAPFYGDLQADYIFMRRHWPNHDMYVEGVEFDAAFGPPTGADGILQLLVDGIPQESFTLTDGALYLYVPSQSNDGAGILVGRGQKLEAKWTQVGSTTPGVNVVARLHLRKRVVSV